MGVDRRSRFNRHVRKRQRLLLGLNLAQSGDHDRSFWFPSCRILSFRRLRCGDRLCLRRHFRRTRRGRRLDERSRRRRTRIARIGAGEWCLPSGTSNTPRYTRSGRVVRNVRRLRSGLLCVRCARTVRRIQCRGLRRWPMRRESVGVSSRQIVRLLPSRSGFFPRRRHEGRRRRRSRRGRRSDRLVFVCTLHGFACRASSERASRADERADRANVVAFGKRQREHQPRWRRASNSSPAAIP
mgnify:CR=1 FL=1